MRLVLCTRCGGYYRESTEIHDLTDCTAQLRNELVIARSAIAHEKCRARRVVRVFWRVRDAAGRILTCVMFGPHVFRDGPFSKHELLEFISRDIARSNRNKYGGKVYRVTVRRKKKESEK